MRKLLSISIALLLTAIGAQAQVIKTSDLEKYAKERYGDKWLEAAANLQPEIKLDKNQSITYQQVIDAPGKTKEQLYVAVNYWVTSTFVKDKQAISLNDKEAGSIIISSTLADIAQHMGGVQSFSVHITPVIKIDIKDGKVRATLTVQNYDILRKSGGWVNVAVDVAAITAGVADDSAPVEVKYDEQWEITKRYPFADKDKQKKVSSKALVMTHAYSSVVMDKIAEAVKSAGDEGDDW
ncbi:MAG: DUF4468 domain-containing protein [Bacteroidales bacterium]|nr:DUF4468 domain-containing protein [Bacteroidales bacterium]